MAKRTIHIGRFGPSARQIFDAACAVNEGPECQVVVDNSPKEGELVLGGVPFDGRRYKDYDRGLAYLHDLTTRRALKNQVFLGGACDPTTWREDIAIPALKEAGCAYWNPQVADWSAEHQRLIDSGIPGGMMEAEAAEKLASYVLLFVFDPQTRALATLNEVVEFAASGAQRVVLVSAYIEAGQDVAGQAISAEEAMDINIARAELMGWAKAKDVPVFASIDDAVAECAEIMQAAAVDHTVIEAAG